MAQTDDFPVMFGKFEKKKTNLKDLKEVELQKLQKKIIEALEEGKDTAALQKELRELKANIEANREIEELKKVADQRLLLKDKAAKILKTVSKQSKAISEFLEKRDLLIEKIKPLIEPFKELVKLQAASFEREPGSCYLINDIGQFNAMIKDIPADYLPKGFGCEFLTMEGGKVEATGKANEAYFYFLAAYGILTAFSKELSKLPLTEAEGLMSIKKDKA
jgi:hypothetical protein